MQPARPTRRRVLVAAGGFVAGLAACTTTSSTLGRSTPTPPAPDPSPDADAGLTARAVADVRALAAAYARALTAAPSLATELRALAVEVDRHLTALGAPFATPPTAGSTATRTPGGAGLAVLRRRLQVAERAAAGRRLADSVAAEDPRLARLLASIGGSNRMHAVVLTQPPATHR